MTFVDVNTKIFVGEQAPAAIAGGRVIV